MRNAVVAVLLGIVALCYCAAMAADLDVTLGLGRTQSIWMTLPRAFSSPTNWLVIGLSYGFGRFETGMGVTLIDFETLRLKDDPSLSFHVSMPVSRLGPVNLMASVSMVWNPQSNWVSPAIGVYFAWSPFRFFTASLGGFFQGTAGTTRHPAGLNAGVSGDVIGRIPIF